MSVAIFYPEKSGCKVLGIFGNFCEFLWIFVNFCEFLGLNIGQLRRPISRAIWGLERCSRGLRKCTRDADFKNTLLFDVWPQEACENWQNIWVTCRFCPDPTSNDLVSPSLLRSLGEIKLTFYLHSIILLGNIWKPDLLTKNNDSTYPRLAGWDKIFRFLGTWISNRVFPAK